MLDASSLPAQFRPLCYCRQERKLDLRASLGDVKRGQRALPSLVANPGYRGHLLVSIRLNGALGGMRSRNRFSSYVASLVGRCITDGVDRGDRLAGQQLLQLSALEKPRDHAYATGLWGFVNYSGSGA